MFTKSIVGALFVIGVVGGVIGASAADEGGFTAHRLRGGWGFTVDGTLGGSPTTAVGHITFNGAGGCSEAAILNNDVVGRVELTSDVCSYVVNADGTGVLTVTFIGFPPDPFVTDFVLVDAGKEFRFIVSGAGAIASGVAKRQ